MTTLGHQLAPLDTWGTRHFMRPDEAAAARVVVCANATDVADARHLLRMLGLIPGAPTQHTARRHTPRPRATHGEDRMYKGGCRCDECRAGHAAAQREQAVQRRKAARA